jgi:transcriptional regulator with GAF, ATPase, and Fis domain
MEPANSSPFDANFATQLLLELAHEHSVDRLLQRFIRAGSERPNIAWVQIWLIGEGDLCGTCPLKPHCADQSRCLHLAADGDGLAQGGEGGRSGQTLTRLPLGLGIAGKVALTGQENIFTEKQMTPEDFIGFKWLKPEIIRGGGAIPITFHDEILGVLIGYTRQTVEAVELPWGRIFANHLGAAVASARAFEEIQRLKAQLEQQNAYLQEEVVEAKAFGDLVGQSAALQQIISQIDLVAPTEAMVLIQGDTGTGKELVAHEIHRRSRRKDKPLVRVNCASIPKDLFESEFFGHVKGAFTGAIKDRAGRFETAEGGTLFLDEIGEVPMETQGKLLRVLQEKRYERVGEDHTRQANVRIIAATNRDLKGEIAAGRFREDLYYRLHVFPIQVLPLRQRKDDIPLLAKHFIDLSVKELRCPKPRLTRAALTRLQLYDWPGNIRELRNVIERAVILARGGPLNFDLPVADSSSAPAAAKPRLGDPSPPAILTEAEMQQRDRDNILAALIHSGWKLRGSAGAAELLGVKPTTLLARMKKMGLKRPG